MVTETNPADDATNVAVNSTITITFNEPVDVTDATFEFVCGQNQSIGFTNMTGTSGTTFTLKPSSSLPANTTCTVTVSKSEVTDRDAEDPPDTMINDYPFSFTTAP
jgi:methionine-rich copper-binding protein CopC